MKLSRVGGDRTEPNTLDYLTHPSFMCFLYRLCRLSLRRYVAIAKPMHEDRRKLVLDDRRVRN